MELKEDMYMGIPRLKNGSIVVTGLVAVSGKKGYPYYEVRENGVVLKKVAGLSNATIALAKEVAKRNGLGGL